jgi:predicted O-methyltransferase YrrM
MQWHLCRTIWRGKNFSCDWTSEHIAGWRRALGPWRFRKIQILEIGTWEGRSALFFLHFLHRSTITCIDTFRGTSSLLALPEHRGWARQVPYVEHRFDRNLGSFGKRVEKIIGESVPSLDRLIAKRRIYDLVYVDASHRYQDVAADSARAWRLLRKGGILIWDDYGWRPKYPVLERPQQAIDEFLDAHARSYILLEKRYQVIIKRVGE